MREGRRATDTQSSERNIRAAVVQAAPVAFDRERTLDRVAELTAAAAAERAQLVVFPEAFVSGYPKGADFGAVVGSRSRDGREWFRATTRAVWTSRAPLSSVSARSRGRTQFASSLMPTATERLIWGFGDGSTLTVLPTPLGRLGAVICWENSMPQLRLAMYGQRIELYCAPTVDDRETWLPTMRHTALEGRCCRIRTRRHGTDEPAERAREVKIAVVGTDGLGRSRPMRECRQWAGQLSDPWLRDEMPVASAPVRDAVARHVGRAVLSA